MWANLLAFALRALLHPCLLLASLHSGRQAAGRQGGRKGKDRGSWINAGQDDALGLRKPLEEEGHEVVGVLHMAEEGKGSRHQPYRWLLP